jgi:hypothetical protein
MAFVAPPALFDEPTRPQRDGSRRTSICRSVVDQHWVSHWVGGVSVAWCRIRDMSDKGEGDLRSRVLSFWWTAELFSPQSIPRKTNPATGADDRRVVEWQPAPPDQPRQPLPWEHLPPPRPRGKHARVWQHTVYLGTYRLEETFEVLHRVFADARDAYQERPGQESACAGLLVDHQGRLVPGSAVLSSALWAVGRAIGQSGDPGPVSAGWMNGFGGALEEFSEEVDEHEGRRRDDANRDSTTATATATDADTDTDGAGKDSEERAEPGTGTDLVADDDADFDPESDAEGGEQLPLDSEAVVALLGIAHQVAGVGSMSGLATQVIRIESKVVFERPPGEEQVETDFLNSFYLEDLEKVRQQVAAGLVGTALGEYLLGDDEVARRDRVDVVAEPGVVDAGVSVGRLPWGRWPSDPEHPLALSQQFAVNAALQDLASAAGLLGVNGPPGTGKTTMLRDILAGNVVERARRLAALSRADEAFTGELHEWNAAGGYPRKVRQLRPELTGFEMVVASANNAAVENVTDEIPARSAIHKTWKADADYFAAIATKTLTASGPVDPAVSDSASDPDGTADGTASGTAPAVGRAWGLVAARLGNKRNRNAFTSVFWFGPKPTTKPTTSSGRGRSAGGTAPDGGLVDDRAVDSGAADGSVPDSGVPRMQSMLQEWANHKRPRKPWHQARSEFQRAEQQVETLVKARADAEARLAEQARLANRQRDLAAAVDRADAAVREADQRLAAYRPAVDGAVADRERARQAHARQLAARPGFLETLFSFGGVTRDWRRQLAPLAQALGAAEVAEGESAAHRDGLQTLVEQARDQLAVMQRDLAAAERAAEVNAEQRATDRRRFGDAYPNEDRICDARELRAPWLDAELDQARSDLFLAALELHKDFIAATATTTVEGLRAAVDVVAGRYPRDLEPEKVLAAWQLFFLVVPMVSTTFASLGRMFASLGQESLGWVFVDEAGQAAPQYAAGAIWRARRAVVVGDPMQLEPVISIPEKSQRDIAASFGLSATWLAPRASVQTLADRVAGHGTLLYQGEQEVWVSAPLRVHRRCDDPMFSLCNQIAYNDLMVNGVHRPYSPDDLYTAAPDPIGIDPTGRENQGIVIPEPRLAPVVVQSHWADEPATTPGTHLQSNQIRRLKSALGYLNRSGVDDKDIIAISPFREVADQLRSMASSRPGLRAGTIHTAQGREAPVVILVLGGAPDKPGAKAWAAERPNLVNVAASRAKRRLYVIGDHAAWSKHPYFRELAATLPVQRRST